MIDRLVASIKELLGEQGLGESDYSLTVVVDDRSPWLTVDVQIVGALTADLAPPQSFAAWKTTGAVHRCIAGEVQDPELFHVEPGP